MRGRILAAALILALAIALAVAANAVGPGTRAATAPTPDLASALAGVADRSHSHPVRQLPPGHVTLAQAHTPRGAVAITLHRIRYSGHVSLCVSEGFAGGATQSCARYPLGPRSNQPIGRAPVWWADVYIDICSAQRFQVLSGLLLRPGLTAWLRTAEHVSRMAAATVPRAFAVAGKLIYATTGERPAAVIVRNASGAVVYSEPVLALASLPRATCPPGGRSGSASVAFAPGSHEIP